MKICSTCKVEKEETEFFFKNKATGKIHSQCKDCKRALDMRAYRNETTARSNKIRKRATETAQHIRAYLKRVKQFSKCNVCGDTRWYVLDFHHVRGKDIEIGRMASSNVSMKKIKDELRKCIVVCSNCHREIHYNMRNGTEANLVKAPD